jgi:hypothetical protein
MEVLMRVKTALFSLVFLAATSAAFSIEAFKVTAVSVSVSEPEYRGFCPHKFTFTGRITVNRAGTVRYTWVRSDNIPRKTYTLVFSQKGSQKVTHTWELGSKAMGTYKDQWAQIVILAPNPVMSKKAEFDLTCLPQVQMVRKLYKVSGGVFAGGAHVDWLEGMKLRFKLMSGTRTLSTYTGTFSSIGSCFYTLVVFNAPGRYRVVVEPVHPTDPSKFYLCFNRVDPDTIYVNLTEEAPTAINQNFSLRWSWRHLDMGQEAFDSPCW